MSLRVNRYWKPRGSRASRSPGPRSIFGRLALLASFSSGAAFGQMPEMVHKVETARVREMSLVETLNLTGSIEAWREIEVGAKLRGQIAAIPVEEGEAVAAGALLFEQDSRFEKIALDRAKAELDKADAELKKLQSGFQPEEVEEARRSVAAAEARLVAAEDDWDRVRPLAEQGILPASEATRARSAYEVARSEVSQAQARLAIFERGYRTEDVQIADAEVRVRRATVDELERRLADYRIVAPESGIIVTRMRDAGEWSAEGETVVTLLVMNPMRVRIEAPQADLPSIRAGQKARMRVDGLDGEAFEAEVVQIIPRARLATRNFPVLLQVNNESGRLAAGMFARVELNVGRERTGLAVPREAVQFRGLRRTIYRLDPLPKDYVYIAPPVATGGRGRRGGAPPVAPDAIAAEVEVTIVAERMDMVFVEARQADERLEAGTEIVSMGASRLHDRSLLLRLGVDSDGAGAGAGAPR